LTERAKVAVEKPSGKELWIPCAYCNTVTSHKILTAVSSEDESEEGDIQVREDYWTVQCQGCKDVSFCHESRCSEDAVFLADGDAELRPTRKLYPARVQGRPRMRGVYELPHPLLEIYTETHSALCNGLPILAGIGLRAIVEAVCMQKSSTGKDLKQKIDSLASLGLITADGAKILHSLRFMGNKAAHEVKKHTETEIDAAFDVIEILLQGVYVSPKRAAKLPPAPA
jgi:hypothetical protein